MYIHTYICTCTYIMYRQCHIYYMYLSGMVKHLYTYGTRVSEHFLHVHVAVYMVHTRLGRLNVHE